MKRIKKVIDWIRSGEETHVILALLALTVASAILSVSLPFDSKFAAYAMCVAVFFGLGTIACMIALYAKLPGEEQEER